MQTRLSPGAGGQPLRRHKVILLIVGGVLFVLLVIGQAIWGTGGSQTSTENATAEDPRRRVEVKQERYTSEPTPAEVTQRLVEGPALAMNHGPMADQAHEKILANGQVTNTLLREMLGEMKKAPKIDPKSAPAPKPVGPSRAEQRKHAAKDAEEKLAKMKAKKPTLWVTPELQSHQHDPGQVRHLKTPWSVTSNTKIQLLTEAKVTNEAPGAFVAVVSETVYDSETQSLPVIPQGAKVGCEPTGGTIAGDTRMTVRCSRLTYRGVEVKMGKTSAGDREGTAGLGDQVDNHYGRILAMVVANSVLKLGSSVSVGGAAAGVTDQLAENLAEESSREGQKQTRQALRTDPTLTIRPSYPMSLLLIEPLELNEPLMAP